MFAQVEYLSFGIVAGEVLSRIFLSECSLLRFTE